MTQYLCNRSVIRNTTKSLLRTPLRSVQNCSPPPPCLSSGTRAVSPHSSAPWYLPLVFLGPWWCSRALYLTPLRLLPKTCPGLGLTLTSVLHSWLGKPHLSRPRAELPPRAQCLRDTLCSSTSFLLTSVPSSAGVRGETVWATLPF